MRSPKRSLTILILAALVLPVSAQQQSPTQLVANGEIALATGRYFAAVEEFQSALLFNPNYAEALAGMAEAYYWLSEYDQAADFAVRALRSAGDLPSLLTLAGRIAIGQGKLESAAAYFARARAVEPNNVDARLGQAELAVAQGQSSDAIAELERSLLINPEHRKTLLSLVLIYEQVGRTEIAREYLDIARRVHRDSAEVHVVAGEYFLRGGDYQAAQEAAETALLLSPGSPAALGLLGEAAVMQGDFSTALNISEQQLQLDRNNVSAWYTRAVAQYRLSDIESAFVSIRTALAIDSEAEIPRLWAEWAALQQLPLDDEIRAELADERRALAEELARQFRFGSAIRAYRRALQLSPLDLELRSEFAELNRRAGNNATYLRELELLVENGLNDINTERAIEVFTEALSDTVASDWGVDQFTLERERSRVAVYAPRVAIAGYPDAATSIVSFIRRTLASETGIEVVDSAMISGFSQAYERARANSVHYFILLDIDSSTRVFGLGGTLFVGRTGAAVGQAQSVRTGSGRVTSAADSFVSRLVRQLPVSARIIERRGSAVLIDRGARDGIAIDNELVVLDPEAVTLAPTGLGYTWAPEAELGTLRVTRVDELVAEGTVQFSGSVDLISPRDLVSAPRLEEEEVIDAPLFPVLYERIRSLR